MKRALILMCSIFFVAIGAFGSVTGSVVGTVTDTAGSVIPGATVVALNVETGVKISATETQLADRLLPCRVRSCGTVKNVNVQSLAVGKRRF